jgi:thymidylate synthase
MKNYIELLSDILENGDTKQDRTGTGTKSVTTRMLRMNMANGFPLLTTKKMWSPLGHSFKSIAHELLWFLSGSTNIRYLQEHGVTIWDEWADENGELGPVYGSQWRFWMDYRKGFAHSLGVDGGYITFGTIDQIRDLMEGIKTNPFSRRHMVSAWNPSDTAHQKLPPCHYGFQFIVRPSGYIDMQFNMRSVDTFLGLPFNIASYALLLHMVAQQTGYTPGELIWVGTDVHIYLNHLDQVNLQITREPHPLPKLIINRKPDSIFDYKYEDFEIVDYISHAGIKAPVSV